MNLLTMSIADKKYNTMKVIVILNLKYPITGNSFNCNEFHNYLSCAKSYISKSRKRTNKQKDLELILFQAHQKHKEMILKFSWGKRRSILPV